MRKRVIEEVEAGSSTAASLLPIEDIAEVEVSSESADAPIEGALLADSSTGWRAGTPGQQRIRIVFDQPQHVRRMTLKFVERERHRTQEFVIGWSTEFDTPPRMIVRQQWTFSPEGSITESETYDMDLQQVRVLELTIKPDIGDPTATATLAEWRIFRERS